MQDLDLVGALLIIISGALFIIAIRSKKAYYVVFAVMYSFAALPLIFLTENA